MTSTLKPPSIPAAGLPVRSATPPESAVDGRLARHSGRPSTLTDALMAVGMSRADLARTLHLSRPTVSGWANGRSRPARHYWPSLGRALGLTQAEIEVLFADGPPARHDGGPLPSLAFVRRHSGLTQRALARAVGVAPTTLAMWETAGVRVPQGLIDVIAHVLDTDVAGLTSRPPCVGVEDPRPLRRLRKNAGMSQREAAAHLGIAIATIARYESGDRRLPVKMVRRMAALYRCPTSSILRHSGTTLLPLPPGRTWGAEQVPEGIRAARLAAGLTKVQVGRAVGRSAQAVYKWELGLARPRPQTCRRLEVLLGLPPGRISYDNPTAPVLDDLFPGAHM